MTDANQENLDYTNEAEEVATSEEATTESHPEEGMTEREKELLERVKKAEAALIGLKKEKKAAKEEPKPELKKPNADTFDYGELAYLEMKGVKSDEEAAFVKKMMERTGDSLKDVLADDYVKNRLKSIREEKATKEAMPSNTRRSQTSGKDSVDYWINKGELPPMDQVELRRKVVNAKIDREKQRSKFSDNPIVNSLG
jgi:Xaa-Pro aminopeptidase